MRTNRVLIVFAVLTAGVAPLVSEAASDLVINEVSPVASVRDRAWIELYNPSSEEVALAGLVVATADGDRFVVPPTFPSLRPGGFLLIRFGHGPARTHEEEGPPHRIEVTVSEALAHDWLPPRGELAIYRPNVALPGDLELVDYVAWGAPGAAWSHNSKRLTRWSEHSFVPLAEGFGMYDPGTGIEAGASIGLYPGSGNGTPGDWVIYDPDEASPGRKNHVPRPKAFTLADGAEIGGQSFAVGWARRKGDEWYRFQLAKDKDFGSVVVDERLVTPVIRIGEPLPEGRYYYRVSAFSADLESTPSYTMEVALYPTPCDWPIPPAPWIPGWNPVHEWLKNPDCSGLPICEINESIEFRFQRKDTHLVCLSCSSEPSLCAWDHPQWYSHNVCFRGESSRPCYVLSAGGDISKTCAKTEFLGMSGANGLPVSSFSCDHGNQYCVMASLSMMASAYRTCLSQDRIAFAFRGITSNHEHDLLHDGAGPQCAEGSDADLGIPPHGQECSKLMRWALGIPEADFKVNPLVDSSFIAAYFTPIGSDTPPPTIDFGTVKTWIDAGRTIMSRKTEGGDHMRVVAGYCEEESPNPHWVFVFDPKTGPWAQKFESWLGSSKGNWVGPAVVGPWSPIPTLGTPPDLVRWDEVGVWGDWDNDGLMDFDETRRFGLCPFLSDTDDNNIGDKDEQLYSINLTAADPCGAP